MELTLAASEFTLGNVVTIVVFLILGAGAYYRLRGVKNEELEGTADFWREQAESLKQTLEEVRVRIVEVEVQREEQRALKHDAITSLRAEQLKTDLTGVVRQLADSHSEIVARLDAMEKTGAGIVETLEERMGARFDAFLKNQETFAAGQKALLETMQGLVQAVSAMKKA